MPGTKCRTITLTKPMSDTEKRAADCDKRQAEQYPLQVTVATAAT